MLLVHREGLKTSTFLSGDGQASGHFNTDSAVLERLKKQFGVEVRPSCGDAFPPGYGEFEGMDAILKEVGQRLEGGTLNPGGRFFKSSWFAVEFLDQKIYEEFV